MNRILHAFAVAAIVAGATPSLAIAQDRGQSGQVSQAPGTADPHGHSETATPSGAPPSGSGGMQQNMMRNMMGQGMMGDGAQGRSNGGSGPMRSMGGGGPMGMGGQAGMGMPMMRMPMMKVMFAIVDRNGDGAISFDEVTELHKRVFDAIDADNDGRVTRDEIGSFFRD